MQMLHDNIVKTRDYHIELEKELVGLQKKTAILQRDMGQINEQYQDLLRQFRDDFQIDHSEWCQQSTAPVQPPPGFNAIATDANRETTATTPISQAQAAKTDMPETPTASTSNSQIQDSGMPVAVPPLPALWETVETEAQVDDYRHPKPNRQSR